MNTILQDLSTSAMSKAVRSNLYAFFRNLGQSPHVECYEDEGLLRWHSAIAHPWFNGVLVNRLPAADEAQTIGETVAYFQTKKARLFTWWIGEGLETAAWEQPLFANGLGYSSNTPGMAADLNALTGNTALPPQFRVMRVSNWEMLQAWTDTLVNGFGFPSAWKADFQTLIGDWGFDGPFRSYLGYLRDKPVATAALFLGAGVAGIYCVSTLPEARRQGLGAAITLAALEDARKIGYRIGILQSSTMGFHVYQQLGFQHLCNLDNFYWKEPSAVS